MGAFDIIIKLVQPDFQELHRAEAMIRDLGNPEVSSATAFHCCTGPLACPLVQSHRIFGGFLMVYALHSILSEKSTAIPYSTVFADA